MTTTILLPYVDDSDPLWRADHDATGHAYEPERYRSWGTLRYLLRSYAECLPWADVLLIVARESQVPEWYAGDYILHEQFVPAEHLPTFNSTTLECFYWNIGLDGDMIIANDDIFALRPLCHAQFFDMTRPMVNFGESDGCDQNVFHKSVRCAMDVVADALGTPRHMPGKLVKVEHNLQPVNRRQFEVFAEKVAPALDGHISQFRNRWNVNQWAYGYIADIMGIAVPSSRACKSIRPDSARIDEICELIREPTADLLCIMDHEDIGDVEYETSRSKLLFALMDRFDEKSRYEND